MSESSKVEISSKQKCDWKGCKETSDVGIIRLGKTKEIEENKYCHYHYQCYKNPQKITKQKATKSKQKGQ